MSKNLEKRIGNVYAVHTIYGDCLIQVANTIEMSSGTYDVVRVFNKKYSKLPDDINGAIQSKHDYIIGLEDVDWLLKTAPKDALPPDYNRELRMRAVTDHRKSCATFIGKFGVPLTFAMPHYCKNARMCGYVPRDQTNPWPPLDSWDINFENPDKNSCVPFLAATVIDWVTEHLKMNFHSDEWYPFFVELGPRFVTDSYLIMMLEDDFSLDMWLPSDFEWKCKKYFQPTKEWTQLKQEEAEREKEKMERYRSRMKRREELKAQGIEFKFWETQTYKNFIKLVKE